MTNAEKNLIRDGIFPPRYFEEKNPVGEFLLFVLVVMLLILGAALT